MERIERFWREFLVKTGRAKNTGYFDAFHFCNDEKNANELLELVLEGAKRATASAVPLYEAEGEALPQIGDLSIVTDWDGNPKCVIETTAVITLPFREMTYDICKREGEDENLESWQKNHIKFFTEEMESIGSEFTWDMEVLFEDFEVIYRA